MRYVNSPWWDALFIWSGLPIGLGLAGLWWSGQREALVLAFTLFLALDAAHLLSPMALTATYAPLRQRALSEPVKFIVVPGLLLLLPALFWGRLGSYAGIGFLISAFWNWWHFGLQQFGVVQIYRRLWGRTGWRWLDKVVCLSVCAILLPPFTLVLSILGIPYPEWFKPIALVTARLPMPLFFLVVGTINVNHWLTALALSQKVVQIRWWLWLVVLVVLGASGYLWAHQPGGGRYNGLRALVYLNYGVGFAHFWLDGLIWRRSSPAMREVLS